MAGVSSAVEFEGVQRARGQRAADGDDLHRPVEFQARHVVRGTSISRSGG